MSPLAVFLCTASLLPAAEALRTSTNPYPIALAAAVEGISSPPGAASDEVVVEKSAGITDKLPPTVGRFRIVVVDREELRQRVAGGEETTLLVVFPMDLRDGVFRVPFAVYRCRYRPGRLFRRPGVVYSFSRSAQVKLSYDGASGLFTVAAVDFWRE